VHDFSLSLDHYTAGPRQDLDHPPGIGGERLHERLLPAEGDRAPVDEHFIARGGDGVGATIMGRDMFGPVRKGWDDAGWTGWWGEDPPFHHDVAVLTHHARARRRWRAGWSTSCTSCRRRSCRAAASGCSRGSGGAVAGCSCAEFAPSHSVTRVRLRRPRSEVFDTMES
jgi:dihydrofolate reductase